MKGWLFGVGGFLLILTSPVSADKATVLAPRELTASWTFDHRLQDMMTFVMSHYEVKVTLRVEPSGAAQLELQGNLDTKTATLQPDTPGGSRTPAELHRHQVNEKWTGQAHLEQESLIVNFDNAEAYRPALAVSVLWRCTPTTITVEDKSTAVWVCLTSQPLTQATGAGHTLPPYLQVPIYLTLPAVRLRVQTMARGGADHRSSIDQKSFSRQR